VIFLINNVTCIVYILPEKPNYINHFEKKKPIIAGELEGGFTEDPVGIRFSGDLINRGSIFN
jgi:hypothetical protein